MSAAFIAALVATVVPPFVLMAKSLYERRWTNQELVQHLVQSGDSLILEFEVVLEDGSRAHRFLRVRSIDDLESAFRELAEEEGFSPTLVAGPVPLTALTAR